MRRPRSQGASAPIRVRSASEGDRVEPGCTLACASGSDRSSPVACASGSDLAHATAAGDLCVYGSGLLSSFGEIGHCIESPEVQRFPFQLEWVVNQYFEIDHYQPLLFIVDSFEQLFAQVDELERWMKAGRLDNVSPGEPAVNEADLQSFLQAQTAG